MNRARFSEHIYVSPANPLNVAVIRNLHGSGPHFTLLTLDAYILQSRKSRDTVDETIPCSISIDSSFRSLAVFPDQKTLKSFGQKLRRLSSSGQASTDRTGPLRESLVVSPAMIDMFLIFC